MSQLRDDNKWHPVGFTSKGLDAAKRNYKVHNKGLLSVIHGLEEWSHVSRMGFPARIKCNKVRIDKEKTLRMIVREKLSKRAVMKDDGLGRVYLQERRLTPIRISESNH